MKKHYTAPEMKVMKIHPTAMLAFSRVGIDPNEVGSQEDADAREYISDTWDGEW